MMCECSLNAHHAQKTHDKMTDGRDTRDTWEESRREEGIEQEQCGEQTTSLVPP